MEHLIAAKFGGTSMGTAESIGLVAGILIGIPEKKVAIVSATSGTTDQLINLGKLALNGEDWASNYDQLVKKHQDILEELNLSSECNLHNYYQELEKLLQGIEMLREISASAHDRLVGLGERMSSQILAALLRKRGQNSEAFDAFDLIFTDNNYGAGNVDFEKTNKAIAAILAPKIKEGVLPIITGFVAQSQEGKPIVLGRGGSDYTGAIIGSCLGAQEIQIWTDVDGILNADPRLIETATVLEQLSYSEAGELAYFGAKVLHPKTIRPAIKKGIPVKILNTFNPLAVGTRIDSEEVNSLKSVTFRRGVSVVNVCSARMLDAQGFLVKIFEVFASFGLSVDVVSTSEVSVSTTIDGEVPEGLVAELERFAEVEVVSEMAIVCLVGEGIKGDTKVLGRLFSTLSDFDVEMVSQGASKRNITFVVNEKDAGEVTQKVFGEFF
jgi:aspartate kinase